MLQFLRAMTKYEISSNGATLNFFTDPFERDGTLENNVQIFLKAQDLILIFLALDEILSTDRQWIDI